MNKTLSAVTLIPILASAGCSTFDGFKQDLARASDRIAHLSGYEQARSHAQPRHSAPNSGVDIGFASGSARLPNGAENALSSVHQALTADPKLQLRVEGHTDAIGRQADNQRLSSRRAVAVKRWFTRHGIADSRIATVALATTAPLASNDSSEGRQQNRRVHLDLTRDAYTATNHVHTASALPDTAPALATTDQKLQAKSGGFGEPAARSSLRYSPERVTTVTDQAAAATNAPVATAVDIK